MKDRRELLKRLAVSTAWATPVVASVVLPVHATSSPSENTKPLCSQCGEQLLNDGIGLPNNWDSLQVNYNSNENSYLFDDVGTYMLQLVVLNSSCVSTVLRLNLIGEGGSGPLKISIAVGNTVEVLNYPGGDLTYDFPVPSAPEPTNPALVRIEPAKLVGFDLTTKFSSPTLTVIC